MKVHLLFFAALREKMKRSEAVYEVDPGETVSSLARRLVGTMERSLLFAVNREYVSRDHELREGDEIAFIPPVSGG